MSLRNTVDTIHELLIEAKRGRRFDSVSEELAWERGYLTGFLARLAEDDSFVKVALKQNLQKKIGRVS